MTGEWKGFAVAVCVAVVCGCATPGTMRSTRGADLSRVRRGMSIDDVRRAANTSGEPIAIFQSDGKRYEIRKFEPKESVTSYYALWVDDRLEGLVPRDEQHCLEDLQPRHSGPSVLPHSEGFDVLLEPFVSAKPPEDLNIPKTTTVERQKKKELVRAEMVMWAPVFVVLLPVMPIQLLVVAKGAAGYGRYYFVDLGMSAGAVKNKLGEPTKVLGDPASYGVWTYDYDPTEGEPLLTTVGFREGRVTWIRYRHDPVSGISTNESACIWPEANPREYHCALS